MLKNNAVFTYGQGTANGDGTVILKLTCPNPGPGMLGDYTVTLSSSDVSTIMAAVGGAAKKSALDGIVSAYLISQYRPSTVIQSALDNLIGQTVTV